MPGKRALAILELGQLVRVKTLDKGLAPSTAFESLLANIIIKPEYPGSVMIELEDGVVLEFVGAWGTLDKEAAGPDRD